MTTTEIPAGVLRISDQPTPGGRFAITWGRAQLFAVSEQHRDELLAGRAEPSASTSGGAR